MSTGKILGGILLGVGAIAAAPFTGGGSLFAAGVSLSAALGGGALAIGAAAVGGVAGAVIGEKEKEDIKESNKNHFKEGTVAGGNKVKEKFSSILKTQKDRDELVLISMKLGVYISKIDNIIHHKELKELNKLCFFINQNPSTPKFIKDEVDNILNRNIEFNEIQYEVNKFLNRKSDDDKKKTLVFFDKLIKTIVEADNHSHPKEIEFMNKWAITFKN
ncbi:TerB family tellurite resistance protein [Tenacibaculum finnmarkense]|uniref:tellurite resistance TerB family protein n=1 Tax=Tenacibaculum finnmarkense TaxID=2781243 RepID=UPI001EFA87DA|nr:TerB family tellurite resistance protein [Tenacibaculum finnmarkense]MCG8796681.1 TerB family tellurite resistance protein [Tenacibaculum finnmarkense]MCG8798999.1 TerB family tellurite resistance protein [Tenacibaculum finnmarkense]